MALPPPEALPPVELQAFLARTVRSTLEAWIGSREWYVCVHLQAHEYCLHRYCYIHACIHITTRTPRPALLCCLLRAIQVGVLGTGADGRDSRRKETLSSHLLLNLHADYSRISRSLCLLIEQLRPARGLRLHLWQSGSGFGVWLSESEDLGKSNDGHSSLSSQSWPRAKNARCKSYDVAHGAPEDAKSLLKPGTSAMGCCDYDSRSCIPKKPTLPSQAHSEKR